MRAIRYYGPGDIRLDEIPQPDVEETQLKIKVAWNGICGSDLHAFSTLLSVMPTTTKPHPVTNATLPIVMGHEFSGTIVELGTKADASKFHVGQNVIVEPLLTCGKCSFCLEGSRNVCRDTTFIGLGGGGGGLSEFISVNQDFVHPLPSGFPLDIGALLEPLAVAWHAVKRSNIRPGDSVLVLGAGPVGLMTLKAAKAFGAGWIAVSEPALKRRQLAILQGATVVYDPSATATADIPAVVRAATGDRGADVVFECAGIQRALDTAFKAVRPRGNIVNVAVWGNPKPGLDINALTHKEIILTSVIGYDRIHPEMLQAVVDGKVDTNGMETLITRRIPLEDFVEKGVKALVHEKDEHVKILVYPGLNPPSSSFKASL